LVVAEFRSSSCQQYHNYNKTKQHKAVKLDNNSNSKQVISLLCLALLLEPL
jgi:hypothetical protein